METQVYHLRFQPSHSITTCAKHVSPDDIGICINCKKSFCKSTHMCPTWKAPVLVCLSCARLLDWNLLNRRLNHMAYILAQLRIQVLENHTWISEMLRRSKRSLNTTTIREAMSSDGDDSYDGAVDLPYNEHVNTLWFSNNYAANVNVAIDNFVRISESLQVAEPIHDFVLSKCAPNIATWLKTVEQTALENEADDVNYKTQNNETSTASFWSMLFTNCENAFMKTQDKHMNIIAVRQHMHEMFVGAPELFVNFFAWLESLMLSPRLFRIFWTSCCQPKLAATDIMRRLSATDAYQIFQKRFHSCASALWFGSLMIPPETRIQLWCDFCQAYTMQEHQSENAKAFLSLLNFVPKQ